MNTLVEPITVLVYYFLAINIMSLIITGYDKKMARAGGWRVSERNLLLLAFIGGAAGIHIGMRIFRHKTRHWHFRIGVPFLIGLNLLFVIYLVSKLL